MAGYFATVSAKLDLDITPFEQGLARSGASVEKFGHTLEHKLLGPRHVMGALATALGLNIEKIGDHLAEMWTGVTEQAKKYYEEIEKLSTEAADKQIDQMRKTLDAEKKLTLLRMDLDRLRRNPAEGAETREASGVEKTLGVLSGISGGAMGPFGAAFASVKAVREEENRLATQVQINRSKITELKLLDEIANEEKKADDEREKKVNAAFEVGHKLMMEGRKEYDERIRKEEKELEIEEKIVKAKWDKVDADRALGQAMEDRSASTLSELAANTQVSGGVTAREIMRLESRAKDRRSRGFGDLADGDISRALKLREGLGALSSREKDPLASERNAILKASEKILESINARLAPVTTTGSGGAPQSTPFSGITSSGGILIS